MKQDRKEQLEQIFKEASASCVEIGNSYFAIAFDTKLPHQVFQTDAYKPLGIVLEIQDPSSFYEEMNLYVEKMHTFLKEHPSLKKCNSVYHDGNEALQEKCFMAMIWANASPEDFKNPVPFLKRRIAFLENGKEGKEEAMLGNPFLEDTKLVYQVVAQDPILETPYCFQSSIQNIEGECYNLPKISFGICGDTCFLYAMQDKENHKRTDPFYKKVKRALYQVGKGVEDDYSAEKITDVSPSFVLALASFLGFIQKEGISNFEVIPYLPLRYQAKIISQKRQQELLSLFRKTDTKKIDEIWDKTDSLQENITNRYLRTFLRIAYHLKNVEVTSYPGDVDNSLHFTMHPVDTYQNPSLATFFFQSTATSNENSFPKGKR